MSMDNIIEARRQIEICNACRYCEGYCSVFPAITRERTFSVADVTQLANLCHDCRSCYYACQYTEPHEFALNFPKALAAVRQHSWQQFAVPEIVAGVFHKSGVATALTVAACFSLLIWFIKSMGSSAGETFYAVVSHNAMVALFAPAFLLPVFAIVLSVRKYWKTVAGRSIKISDIKSTIQSIASMKNLSGGHGDGCNFEDEDRFSNKRRWFHHMVMYGFLLCFASTSTATLMHYLFNLPAPYALFSLPKLAGLTGGILLSIGTLGLAWLKLKADRSLSNPSVWGGEMGFILLLFVVSSSGLALYGFAESNWLAEILAFHLGSVLAFFLLTPYSKMMHGFFRLAALLKDAQKQSGIFKQT